MEQRTPKIKIRRCGKVLGSGYVRLTPSGNAAGTRHGVEKIFKKDFSHLPNGFKMGSMDADHQPMDAPYAKQVIRATERAMGRAAAAAHEDLKHGLNTLATITCIAPFAGMFGTLCGITFDTFRGFDGEKSAGMAAIAEGLSRACLPAALGLLVGLQSLWCYRYFRAKLSAFDHEMEDASLQLVNQLSLHLGRLRSPCPTIRRNCCTARCFFDLILLLHPRLSCENHLPELTTASAGIEARCAEHGLCLETS